MNLLATTSNLYTLNIADSGNNALTPIQTTHEIFGDPLIHSATIAPGGQGTDWRVVNAYNHQYTAVDDGNGGTTNVLIAYDVDYYLIDADGNPVEAGGPERADTLKGTAANDHIVSGGGNDTVYKQRSGDDIIELGAGDDNFYTDWNASGRIQINGGTGRDYLGAGSGRDLIEGGADADGLYGSAESDLIYGDVQIDTATAIAQGATQQATGQQGEWVDAEDGNDIVYGGKGNQMRRGDAVNDAEGRMAA